MQTNNPQSQKNSASDLFKCGKTYVLGVTINYHIVYPISGAMLH
jgi:hypothetical protein